MKTFLTAALLAVSPALVLAETYDSSGTVSGQSSAVVTALDDGRVIMFAPSTQDAFKMDTDGHPFADMTGNCNGTIEINGPAARGTGHCVYENAAGENLVVNWIARQFDAKGAFHGDWIVVGGTGGMASASGGGSFVSRTDQSTGSQNITLSGALTL
ncbi:MAG: hypothetical protein ABJ370_07340 [Paracoccaceae bacterium]